jgi:hypothetical protein
VFALRGDAGLAHPFGMVAATLPPRIILVMSEQWPRALLRATLREAGYDASGTRTLKMALHQSAPEAGRGPVRLVVLDQDALTDADGAHVDALGSTGIPILLLAPRVRRVREGPWLGVARRPLSVGELVQTIQGLLPLPPEARQPVD